ncbi:MAG: two component transcriptional regulator, LuxR family [Actinomycetia bacterium]|nr:two component transcriptional regulator, LuxR family [Actinomycetes bacterium]
MGPVEGAYRVLLVHRRLAAEAIAVALSEESNLVVVGVAVTREEAWDESALYPDVVFLDFDLPDGTAPDLVVAIRRISSETRATVIASRSGPEPSARTIDGPLVSLTSREREVLGLLAQGKSTSDIVSELVVSVHTVRNHIRSILHKLNVHSRLEAVARAGGVTVR